VAEGRLEPNHYDDLFHEVSTGGVEDVFDCLSDSRPVELSATSADMRAVTNILGANAISFRERNAVVVPSQAAYGMARMLDALIEPCGVEVRIFERIEDAEACLDQGRGADD